jgi:hypothetical protein
LPATGQPANQTALCSLERKPGFRNPAGAVFFVRERTGSAAVTDDATPDDAPYLSDANYQALAQSKLPEWAPDTLVRSYAASLQFVAHARQDVHRERLHGPIPLQTEIFGDPNVRLRQASEEAALIWRLATYHPDLRTAWRTIITRERTGFTRPSRAVDVDLIVAMLIDEIKSSLCDFDRLPKRTGKERRLGAGRIARQMLELAQAIEQDEDAHRLASGYLARQAINQHIRDHWPGENQALPLEQYPVHWHLWEALYPPYNPFNRLSDSTVDETGDDVPFARWHAHDRLAWLLRFIGTTPMDDLLRNFATDLQRVAATEPKISRPNSGEARTRFLIRRLSEFMRGCYRSPLDEAVALFVSAALDLPAPLNRDDVRDAR